MRKKLIVKQENNNDCGASCLLSIIRYYGGDISLDKLVHLTKTTNSGTNFLNISDAAKNMGLDSECYYVDSIDKLKEISTPCIAQIKKNNYNHFIVLYKNVNDKLIIMDPLIGKTIINKFDFCEIWTGYIMIFKLEKNIINYKINNLVNDLINNILKSNISNLFAIIALSFFYVLINFFSSFYSKIFFDYIINTSINNLMVISIFFFVLFIFKNILDYFRNFFIIFFNRKFNYITLSSTYKKIVLLPYYFYKEKNSAEILSRLIDLLQIKDFVSKIVLLFFIDFPVFIVSIMTIYFLNKKLLFIILVVIILYLIFVILINNMVKKDVEFSQKSNEYINEYIIETVNGYESIKNNNLENNILNLFKKNYNKVLNNIYDCDNHQNIIMFIKNSLYNSLILLVNFYLFYEIMKSSILIGDYMLLTMILTNFIYPIDNIFNLFFDYKNIGNCIKRGNRLLDYSEENLNKSDSLAINGNITIKNLNYSFDNEKNILKNISLFIKDKDKILLIGNSGSGKSTLMKILYKYYQISRGLIYINNIDINDYELSTIRKEILYISQNERLFKGTIRDNIIMNRDVSKMEFLSICKLTELNEFVDNYSEGYDYEISENGFNLSGGQKQKIILARGLLKKSKIIIIDEALSQIDIESERRILINLFTMYYDKTFIIISHRNNNKDLYNRIINLNNGNIYEMKEKWT